jgi:hypothetical protein
VGGFVGEFNLATTFIITASLTAAAIIFLFCIKEP